MTNFEDGLFRGSKDEILEAVNGQDVKVVLSLQSTWNNEEAMFCFGKGVRRHVLAMCPLIPPSEKVCQYAYTILNSARITGQKAFVHCRKGVDRTGYVVAYYRIRQQGWSKRTAVREMIAEGNSWWLRWWTWFL